MSFSFSQPQTSSFLAPNDLLDLENLRNAPQLAADTHQNALLTQEHNQQVIGAQDMEMVARVGSSLLNVSEEEAARLYPGYIAELQARGYAKQAPSAYPGHAVTRHLVSMAIPTTEQWKRSDAAGAVDAYGNTIGVGRGGGAAAGDGTSYPQVTGARGPGSATRGEAEGGPPAPGSPGDQVARRTYAFWKGKGLSDPQIAGIMAGGPGSESDFTPSVYGDNRSSYGLYQHHGPRLEGMRRYFGLTGSQMPTEQQQNEYAYWEITQGPYAHVGAALANAKTPEEAATIWTRDFGVPADKSEIGRRARGAGRYAGRYDGATAPPGAGGVQVGGDAPAPPGGAPGAAAPTGPGGFAAAIPPPAVAASRPPPPPPPATPSGPATAEAAPFAPYQIAGAMQPPPGGPPAARPTAGPGAPPQPLPPVEAGWGTGTPGTYGYSGGSPTPGTVAPAPAPAPVAPVAPAQAPAAPAAPALAAMPPELRMDDHYLTDRDKQELKPLFEQARKGIIPLTTLQNEVQQRQTFNVQRQKDWQAQQHQAQQDAETRAQHAAAQAQRDIENKRAEAAAAALTEQRRLENARAGVPTGQQRNPQTGVLEPIPGYRGATADERIDYSLKHDDPSSQDYADAWKARKWKMADNGTVIEQDMSGYPPPARSIQRPTFLPQPTGQALDEVRKVDTDARVIVPAIDRYVDLHKAIGGSSWGAYFDNPRDPKAQQLIGAFNAMKTVLRSPAYANTGVLQPAEAEMLKQEQVSPQTIRGLYATPQALEARLHEIKFLILSRQDAELRSVGRDGVIVRDKSDLAKIPDGGKFYDEDGNLRVKTRAE